MTRWDHYGFSPIVKTAGRCLSPGRNRRPKIKGAGRDRTPSIALCYISTLGGGVPKPLKNPLRCSLLLLRPVLVPGQDRIDDPDEWPEGSSLHRRLRPPIAGRYRELQHLVDGPRINSKPPRGRSLAQSLNPNRMSYLRVELYVLHPSPSPELGKGFLAAGFLLRRNRTIRPLQRGIFSPALRFCLYKYGLRIDRTLDQYFRGSLCSYNFSLFNSVSLRVKAPQASGGGSAPTRPGDSTSASPISRVLYNCPLPNELTYLLSYGASYLCARSRCRRIMPYTTPIFIFRMRAG